ncbi:response regulator transcription factor [Marinobacter hydrocarbonoclasticus]|nr:response regulator transcription factor [Marinobacter nauticus]
MSRANLLLIEDDRELALLICQYLEKHDYRVVHLNHGNRLDGLPPSTHFDLVICDLMLPGLDGYQVIEKLRQNFTGPILMMTARGEEHEQIRGLEVGASDYLVKPVSPSLLLARIRAHLRQSQNNALAEPANLVDGLTLDVATRSARLQGENLHLTPAEFALLQLFATHFRQLLTREYLFTHGIGRAYDGMTRTIDGRITRLRRKLEGRGPLTIKTVWGKGYLLTHLEQESP